MVMFLDGLDAKPSDIEFDEYKNCLIGLTEATWHLSSEFFPNIKGSKGRMRVVLLLRPDVFDTLNLPNSNCKIADNSVLFHWHTTKNAISNSNLFKLADKYFTTQTEDKFGWDHFFQNPNACGDFQFFLTHSFQRPRDIFAAIKILLQLHREKGLLQASTFERGCFHKADFFDRYSEYLRGEVRNYANYYMTNEDFDTYVLFFQYCDGSAKFNYAEFTDFFNMFTKDSRLGDIVNKKFLSNPETMLQFWYDVNVIGYSEEAKDGTVNFVHWSYRERSTSKIMPKVKLNSSYIIHPGVAKSLDIGKKLNVNRT